MTEQDRYARFMQDAGIPDWSIRALVGDASSRRYSRLSSSHGTLILMDAGPQSVEIARFVDVAGWLQSLNFVAPAVIHVDVAQGLLLLEDFGDARMKEAIDVDPDAASRLYERAVDTLVELRAHPAGPLEPYDAAVLHREADLFVDWYCPAIGLDVDGAGWTAAWNAVFGHALAAEPVTVLRDYHAENLMLVGDALGLLDFQDALAGHPAYDLVSLLQDARRDVDPTMEDAMLARYRAATGEGDSFLAAYHVLGAQRNAKILGIFTRLWRRDGKPRYPALCPRVWAYLERDLSQPVLAPVAAWFDANVPPEKRGDPLVLAAG